VWVVDLSKDSEADRAGIQQGDQILQVCFHPLYVLNGECTVWGECVWGE
jgi:C-terminal processing protease CtpA/Prc